MFNTLLILFFSQKIKIKANAEINKAFYWVFVFVSYFCFQKINLDKLSAFLFLWHPLVYRQKLQQIILEIQHIKHCLDFLFPIAN